ncbi:MAG: alpha/beta fold hydrolase [Nitrospirota bacterium]|nr:alpha/beta fold hydrolase [Nitrospirota bacterium]
MTVPPFIPHPWLHGPHRMTLIPRWWPRGSFPPGMFAQDRIFQVTPEIGLLTKCHWQPSPAKHPTVLIVHGLEGCIESHYMRGLAQKAWQAGWNSIRINQRNCGGSEHLTPTLYHNGLSQDYHSIIREITEQDGCHEVWLVGYSMGGNLTLKLAGELGSSLPSLRGVAAVCPNIQPAACVCALQRPSNWIYHQYFLKSLKAKLHKKAQLYPGQWDLSRLSSIQTMWEFDEVYTAPDGGYRNAADYYDKTAARNKLSAITIPTLIITAQDDPFIPYDMFADPALQSNPCIRLLATAHGGHCGFFQQRHLPEDPFWAENRIIDWIQSQLLSS